MSATPLEIGTLIVVVLKANHLPNKRHIGKQDPYCVVTVNGEKRRTKTIKRGNQHPEWDEEIRFTLYEDTEDVLARTAHGDGTPPPPPPKEGKGPKNIKGGKIMHLTCFADDPREPAVIGETDVDLTEVLTMGETDEWFTLMHKQKFAGKVYLELTFWSNEAPPEKKVVPKMPKPNKNYGGPGSFIAAANSATPSPNGTPPGSMRVSSMYEHSGQGSDSLPSTMRTASSMAQLDLYVAPYEQRSSTTDINGLVNDFGVLGVGEQIRRRESLPPPSNGSYGQQYPQSSGFSSISSRPSVLDHPLTESASTYSLESISAGPTLRHHRSSISGYGGGSAPYQPPYDPNSSGSITAPPANRPRYNIPSSSSGFMPVPQASGFVPLNSHPSEPSGFVPAQPHTQSSSTGFNQSHFSSQGYPPGAPSQTPAPSGFQQSAPYPSQPALTPYNPQPQQYGYPQQQQYPPLPASAPPPQSQSYIPSPQNSLPPPSQTAPPQTYPFHEAPSHENTPPSSSTTSLASGIGQGSSRPLPPQPQLYGQPPLQPPAPYSLPPSQSMPQHGSYSPSHQSNISFPSANSFQGVPPPPPLGSQEQQSHYQPPSGLPPVNGSIPPPPPPLPHGGSSPARRPSLPPPPVGYQQQQPAYQSLPVPPPPPPPQIPENQSHPLPLPPSHFGGGQGYYPGPPPKPPQPLM